MMTTVTHTHTHTQREREKGGGKHIFAETEREGYPEDMYSASSGLLLLSSCRLMSCSYCVDHHTTRARNAGFSEGSLERSYMHTLP